MEMTKELENAVIPECHIVKVGERNYKLQKLSIKKLFELVKFVGKYLKDNKEKLGEIAKQFGSGEKTAIEDVSLLLDLLSEEQIYELYSILLGEPDIDYIKDNVNLDNGISIILDLLELNRTESVKKNLKRAWEMITNKKTA